jgi:hypothetical protein
LLIVFDDQSMVSKVDKENLTPSEALTRTQRRQDLSKRMANLQLAQSHHMPGLKTWLESKQTQQSSCEVMDLDLWPPSAIPPDQRSLICGQQLIGIETEMRFAQAQQKLEDLRRLLCSRTAAQRFKSVNMIGQHANTKAMKVLHTIESQINMATLQYQEAYTAHLALMGEGDWQRTLQPLHRDDIVGLNERVMRKEAQAELEIARRRAGISVDTPNVPTTSLGLGEGHRKTSWIWYRVPAEEHLTDKTGQLGTGVRIEWAKSRARCHRWREELELLEEEMRRIILYCECQSRWWTDISNKLVVNTGDKSHCFLSEEWKRSIWLTITTPIFGRTMVHHTF